MFVGAVCIEKVKEQECLWDKLDKSQADFFQVCLDVHPCPLSRYTALFEPLL